MASFAVKAIDHVVLTVKSIPKTVDFYTTRLGMRHEVFTSKGSERHALIFGRQKLNLHQSGAEFEPKAGKVQPGSEDLCFITDHPVDEVLKIWQSAGIEILEGGKVVDRTGAAGKLRSVYCRDPDENLIE
ncbi:Glyoxalase/Bleomycin resistance protein/Dihydroxybiphenyl dioxygenase [Neohortaea acidophila]|uniref:Glyoxalase/Bleomycin resistance protein/Dihydroxybiphenyl dioxygenase n=1 Tax=Neohortaea acidophila TaxID=245834 RepID=A0A6A6PSL6_9PEZI|nr:Glyoxalase/Bleomycin resistance protein/Dihydroxybiphenyl dioxygenase [Neohortaea acidophila]KAF2482217.1 Glyoxalase/Bleomycin resistance protein/Dihydroxybiphenyl dioxygenase [Neohortaea acidophila]